MKALRRLSHQASQVSGVDRASNTLSPMTKRELELIAVDPNVLHGQAHIRGARIAAVALALGCVPTA